MKRSFAIAILGCLLLFMQEGAARHSLAHFGEWLQRAHEQGLQPPHDEGPCAICALFSGGSTAAPNGTAKQLAPGASTPPVPPADLTTTASAPSFYLSRAPPAFL